VTTAERLARIEALTTRRAALEASILTIIQGGQAYSAEGRVLTRADLKALREMEKDVDVEIARLRRSSGPRLLGAIYR
jgi:hypothetical protein